MACKNAKTGPSKASESDTDSSTTYSDSDWDSDSDPIEYPNPPSHAYQLRRLAPARAILASGIACIVWGCDALEFAHNIPSNYVDCHLLVDDSLLSKAGTLLVRELGYTYAAPEPAWRQHAFLDSIRLKHSFAVNAHLDPVPRWVLLTPMSYYHVHQTWCSDLSRTLSLPQPVENRTLRFPTVGAYLDALVATYLEPKYGRDWKLENMLWVDIAELIASGVAKKDRADIGRISEAGEAVMWKVSKENRLFVKRILVCCREGSWLQLQKERRMVLSGQYEVRGCSCGRCEEMERL